MEDSERGAEWTVKIRRLSEGRGRVLGVLEGPGGSGVSWGYPRVS